MKRDAKLPKKLHITLEKLEKLIWFFHGVSFLPQYLWMVDEKCFGFCIYQFINIISYQLIFIFILVPLYIYIYIYISPVGVTSLYRVLNYTALNK